MDSSSSSTSSNRSRVGIIDPHSKEGMPDPKHSRKNNLKSNSGAIVSLRYNQADMRNHRCSKTITRNPDNKVMRENKMETVVTVSHSNQSREAMPNSKLSMLHHPNHKRHHPTISQRLRFVMWWFYQRVMNNLKSPVVMESLRNQQAMRWWSCSKDIQITTHLKRLSVMETHHRRFNNMDRQKLNVILSQNNHRVMVKRRHRNMVNHQSKLVMLG